MKNLIVDRRFVVIMLIVFVQSTGATMLVPILPLYAQNDFSMSPRLITILIATFFAGQSIATPFLGRWSDRYGRIPILLISQIGTVLSYVVMAMTNIAWVLFAARAVDGLTGGNYVVAKAYLTDIAPTEKRTEMFGYLASAGGVGFIVGPAIGGVLAHFLGLRVTYFVAASTAAIVVLLTWLNLDETISPTTSTEIKEKSKNEGAYRLVLSNQLLIWSLFIAVMYNLGSVMLQSTFALFGEAELFIGEFAQYASIGIGLLVTVIGLVMVLTQVILLGRLLEKIKHTHIVMLGAMFSAIGMVTLALFQSIPTAIFACIIYGAGYAVMDPVIQSLITFITPEESRGTALGLYSSASTTAYVFANIVSGTLFTLSTTLPLWVGGVVVMLVLIPGWMLHRQYHHIEVSNQLVITHE